MSDKKQQEDTDVAKKDSTKDVDLHTPENANIGSGDTSKYTKKDEQPHSAVKELENVTNQSFKNSSLDQLSKNDNLPTHIELATGTSIETIDELVLNDKGKDEIVGSTQLYKDKDISENLKIDKGNYEAESKLEAKVTSDVSAISEHTDYKETALDDVSDANLELRWTDDDDSQEDCPPLSEEALKLLDQELGITDTVSQTEPIPELSEDKDLNITNVDVSLDFAEGVVKTVSITDETVPKNQPYVDALTQIDQEKESKSITDDKTIVENIDQSVDQSMSTEQPNDEGKSIKKCIDQDKDVKQIDHIIENVVDENVTKSMDEAVKELKQLIDQDDNISQISKTTKLDTENIENTSSINQNDEVKINVAGEDFQSMDVDDSCEIENNESVFEKNTTSEIEPTVISVSENDKNIDVLSDHVMEVNEPECVTESNLEEVNKPSETDIRVSDETCKTINENLSDSKGKHTENVNKIAEDSVDKSTEKHIEQDISIIDVDMTLGEADTKALKESHITVTKLDNIETCEVDEFITPDVTNESVKINTDHRINRPDVMLDIPTQEFEFDDFDDTLDQQAQKEKNSVCDVTSKTVTEIVNQLSKDIETQGDSEDVIEIKADVEEAKVVSKTTDCDTKASHDDQNQSKDEDTVEKDVAEPIDKVKSKESDKIIAEAHLIPPMKSQIVDTSSTVHNIDKDTATDAKTSTTVLETVDTEIAPESSMEIPENNDQLVNTEITPDMARDKEVVANSTKDNPKEMDSEVNSSTSNSANVEKAQDCESIKTLVNIEKDIKSDAKNTSNTTLTARAEKAQDDQSDAHAKPSTSDTEKAQVGLTDTQSQPSTSKVTDTKMTPDAEEAQEVEDSLGLLAESSRVMNDEDDEDPENGDDADGDADDDEDFDPDEEESSNQMTTGNNSEESNPPHSELDIQDDGLDVVFGSDADTIGLVSDSNDANDGFETPLGDSKSTPVVGNKAKSLESATEGKDKVLAPADADVDKAKESDKSTKINVRRSSILSELLAKADSNSTKSDAESKPLKKTENAFSFVNLEGSSEEEDVQGIKESKQGKGNVAAIHIDKGVIVGPSKISAKSDDGIDEVKGSGNDVSKMAEIFNLDSDEDDKFDVNKVTDKPRGNNQCINYNCTSDESVAYYLADRVTIAYYGAARRRKRPVCRKCLDIVTARNEGLVSGIKDLRPLMSFRMSRPAHQLLEISDSDSEGEDDPVGEGAAKLLEAELADLFNDTWSKYRMDARLQETEDYLHAELEKMSKASEEVDTILRDCQKKTDSLRVLFYSSFEPSRKVLPALSIHDTPIASYACPETEEDLNEAPQLNLRYPKRRSSTAIEIPAKKPATGLQAYMENDKKVTRGSTSLDQIKQEDDKDISVVRLSAESAPPELPPPGEPSRPPLRVGAQVYAMKNQYGAWLQGRIVDILPKQTEFTQCRIRFEHKVKNPCKVLSARSLAYMEPSEVRMTIGTRVIALFQNADPANKRDSFYYSGVIAEIPNPVNSYRYLLFFDDGYVQYVHHRHTRLVYESNQLVWEEVHPYSRDFVCNYLTKYPERPMVRMHRGQCLTVEWNGKWWDTIVIQVDAALVKVKFPNGRIEWIYRGSTRLQPLFTEFQAARRGDRTRLPRSTKANTKSNMPYVEYTRSDESGKAEGQQTQTQSEELRRQRTVAKKSTSAQQPQPAAVSDGVVSRVVFYTPKNSVRPYKMVPHTCGPHCKRSDLLSLKDLKTYNPLTKPLLSGWERQVVRHKYYREVMYRAPCGRRVRDVSELHGYLRAVQSEMPVDLFDFNANTHCLAEFVLNKTNVQKKDLSHGKENVPVPCVNYYDHSLPEFCSYNTVRTPTAGVPLNLDPEFLCGCDCDDDCADKTKCACWKMTLEGARTIGFEGPNIGYEYRRLPEPLPSGIYECNSRCKCKHTCLNRVVQNPLQLKLQVFKTLNRGWGIRALNDVPKGAFLCIYAGNLLTDATANLDGLNEGDEYLAELDYIEVVEAMKEGYEDDVPEADKKLDKKELKKEESEPETESSESEEETRRDKNDMEDGDFQPVAKYLGLGSTEYSKRLRRRDRNKKSKEDEDNKEVKKEIVQPKKEDEECITISDDEEVLVSLREPSRFAAQEEMTDSKVVPKYRSIRTHFGIDEACYIMDAKVQGNIGRYLNHSCSPNVFVQNVFVDTHDPRFPWVSFFALHHIRAGTELTWNYNYDIGSVPGKILYCFCGAPNCRGRLL